MIRWSQDQRFERVLPATVLWPGCREEEIMRLFKGEKSDDSVSENKRENPSEGREETRPQPPATTPTASLADYNASMPAAWYPDPDDPSALRYWDGARWAERTQPLPPPPPPPVGEVITTPSPEVAGSATVQGTSETTPQGDKVTGAAEATGDSQDEGQKDVHVWVGATKTAVANALAVGSPEAWLNAAQAAVVVAEMAHTMQMAAHARQIAEQATQGAQVARQEAQLLTEAVTQAIRTAEQTAQAAEVAAREARDAANAAIEREAKGRTNGRGGPESCRWSPGRVGGGCQRQGQGRAAGKGSCQGESSQHPRSLEPSLAKRDRSVGKENGSTLGFRPPTSPRHSWVLHAWIFA